MSASKTLIVAIFFLCATHDQIVAAPFTVDQESSALLREDTLQMVGIGVMLVDEEGFCIIHKLIPDGPADMSGMLKQEDRIVGVAQGNEAFIDVRGMKLIEIPVE